MDRFSKEIISKEKRLKVSKWLFEKYDYKNTIIYRYPSLKRLLKRIINGDVNLRKD